MITATSEQGSPRRAQPAVEYVFAATTVFQPGHRPVPNTHHDCDRAFTGTIDSAGCRDGFLARPRSRGFRRMGERRRRAEGKRRSVRQSCGLCPKMRDFEPPTPAQEDSWPSNSLFSRAPPRQPIVRCAPRAHGVTTILPLIYGCRPQK